MSRNKICQVHHPEHGGAWERWSWGEEESQQVLYITHMAMNFSSNNNNNNSMHLNLGVPQLAANT